MTQMDCTSPLVSAAGFFGNSCIPGENVLILLFFFFRENLDVRVGFSFEHPLKKMGRNYGLACVFSA